MTHRRACVPAWVALLLVLPAPAAGQDAADPPRAIGRAVPDTVAVGEPFHSILFLALPPGAAPELRVPADPAERVETAGAVRVLPPDARVPALRVAVPMRAWTPGGAGTHPAELRVTLEDGTARSWPVALPLAHVRSVLPDDTAGVRPRPPADVLPVEAERFPWWWVALGAVALAALAVFALRRLRRNRAAAVVREDARSRALEALDGARRSGDLEAGRPDLFYETMSAALRTFAARTHPAWGADLTTPELLLRMGRDGARAEEVAALAEVLAAADLAKFARRAPPPGAALDDWGRARRWVETFGGGAAASAAAGDG